MRNCVYIDCVHMKALFRKKNQVVYGSPCGNSTFCVPRSPVVGLTKHLLHTQQASSEAALSPFAIFTTISLRNV